MTQDQVRALFTTWIPRLGLEKWGIEVEFSPVDEGSYMEIDRSTHHDRARIKIAPWLLTGKVPEGLVVTKVDDRFIEVSVVHELLHCCVSDMSSIVRQDLETLLHRDVDSWVCKSYGRAEEHFVDRTAIALVDAFHAANQE